jgi:hypothetical protein
LMKWKRRAKIRRKRIRKQQQKVEKGLTRK